MGSRGVHWDCKTLEGVRLLFRSFEEGTGAVRDVQVVARFAAGVAVDMTKSAAGMWCRLAVGSHLGAD